MSPDTEDKYKLFLRNPQQVGAWCLRVKLTETAQTALQKLLNFEPWYFSKNIRYRSGRGYDEYPTDVPPVVLIRMFAYLRACQPKNAREELPELVAVSAFRPTRSQRIWSRGRYNIDLRGMAALPPRLSPKKRTLLSKASKLYGQHLVNFRCNLVPDNPGKIDFRDLTSRGYFQAAQEPQGVLKVYSIQEETIVHIRELFRALPGIELEFEEIRTFSPETILMEQYVPAMQMLRPDRLLADVSTITNVAQILDEVSEERFVHAIRVTGIAVEELLVEIYETYTHEKAPSSPLGELMNGFQARLKDLISGQSRKAVATSGDAKKAFGQFIEQEKKGAANPSLLSFVQLVQKSLLPLVEEISDRVAANAKLSPKDIKVALFPLYVQRCLGELINLRNRVSHRVERVATSVTNVGYVEAALALRSYIVLATWWHLERGLINYKQSRKKIVLDSTERSARLNEEADDVGVTGTP